MASELTGKIADEQRRSLATYYANTAIKEAAAFLRTPRKSAETKRQWAVAVLGIAEGNLDRIGMGHRYDPPGKGERVGRSRLVELSPSQH